MVQHPLFSIEEIFDRPLKKYELFFSAIDLSSLDKGQTVWRKHVKKLKNILIENG